MRTTNHLLASLTTKSSPSSASAVTAKSSLTSKGRTRLRKAPPPSLESFIQRQRAIQLYRQILRQLYAMPPSALQQRDEFMKHARAEFERNKSVTDITQIRYLISTGKAEMKGWERMIQELAHR